MKIKVAYVADSLQNKSPLAKTDPSFKEKKTSNSTISRKKTPYYK